MDRAPDDGERVAAFGGTLDAGRDEHGFTVRAELPYTA